MSEFHAGELLAAGACLLLGSLVAGAEAAVTSLPDARIRALLDEVGPQRGRSLQRYLDDPTSILTKMLAFRTTALIVTAVLGTNALAHGREAWWKLALLVIATTLAYGVVASLCVTLGRARGRVLVPYALTLSRPLEWLITPIAYPLTAIGRAIDTHAQQRNSGEPPPLTEREVEYMVEQAEESGALDPKRGQMMQNVLDLKDLTARDVMVPRTAMHAVEAATPIASAVNDITEEGHSRVPVYRGQVDNVVGVLHVKDLFRVARPGGVDGHSDPPPGATVESIARKPAFFVAENQSALAVLRDMQARRTHMAVVVDEFGAVAGLVTLEDVLEKVVGDIQDEHDAEEAQFVDQGNGRYLASAAIAIDKLGEQLGVGIPESETYASLGGFLAHRAGKVPGVGTVVEWNGLIFTVREGDARHATKVEIARNSASGRGTSPPPAQAAE